MKEFTMIYQNTDSQSDDGYPTQTYSSVHMSKTLDSLVAASSVRLVPELTWGIIIDLEPFIRECAENKELRVVTDFFEPKKVVEFLVISPDAYECDELYNYIFDTCGGSMGVEDLTNVTDAVDKLYSSMMKRLTACIKIKHAQDSFIFHKWISETQAIFGAAKVSGS